ncbi:histidine ammonia-lyase [Actinosynnema sp. NPDC047251]|uniref:Histidine ammonia-lyase n=1 Tax=Saccharothrix espanaensis (strain ATCC 51144 / DSM 44229 / JCM 9112 / NBRC 15066 / NRRL 15764) TaxID=1179773 RepID=K0K3L7_SACES|nr:histidine ammonia-lyase [Saccharothrix espanaensis]CCH32921.1 Histidine ammonia-lyase [Saccharothrix espanaensis DSM 44229]
MNGHTITREDYSIDALVEIVRERPELRLADDVVADIAAGRKFVDELSRRGEHVYGVNTGFGSLCETRIDSAEVEELQRNHVLSHACGVGEPVPEAVSRLVLLIKLLTLRSGRTGISPGTVEALIALWNAGVIPAIPARGTVGASGDLAPLAHLSLPLLGLGQVHWEGRLTPAAEALADAGLAPIRLQAKDGLALTNGVQYINALAAEAVHRATLLTRCADVVAAVSTQAFSCSDNFYHPLYHSTSRNRHRHDVVRNLGLLLAGGNHAALPTCNRSRQDPYSFRCLPQVHAAARQVVDFAATVVTEECNGVSDNPLFFAEENLVLMGGNLHGQSTATTLDCLAISLADLSAISERRSYQLLSGQRGLPDFLTRNAGLHSGFMVAQYSAAALVNENKTLASPASVDTIPTCQLQEDHVSMGGTAALKLRQVLDNVEHVLAIELMLAVQATELNADLRVSPATARVVQDFREVVPALREDRVLSDDMANARRFLLDNGPLWTEDLGLS